MKAYQIGDQTGLSGLRLAERPDPHCGPGEVLVRVSRVCLNHRDLKILAGEYGPRRPSDRTPCSDGVGVVEAVGPDVDGVAPGERVTCGHFVRWLDGAFSPRVFADDLGVTRDGWLAEKILVPASALVKTPDALTDAQLAVLPSAGVTAWHALVEAGGIRAGDLVLVLGTGGAAPLGPTSPSTTPRPPTGRGRSSKRPAAGARISSSRRAGASPSPSPSRRPQPTDGSSRSAPFRAALRSTCRTSPP